MKIALPLKEISRKSKKYTGGKAYALSVLAGEGMNIPDGICITSHAYNHFISSTGLRNLIFMELNKKSFSSMRWEEIWDISLTIRNFFLNTPLPEELYRNLKEIIDINFRGKYVAVRSSAPGEDSQRTSFAGLHESFLNIRGTEEIIKHIKLVWSSLWSDGALLYRKELGLDVKKSSMAVIVQEIIKGEKSGVVFSVNPSNSSETVIESVHGFNQGLVDGTVEPHRWLIDRKKGHILSYKESSSSKYIISSEKGVEISDLPAEKINTPPLQDEEVLKVFNLSMACEKIFASPQDVEWTFRNTMLYALQSRPVTAVFFGDDTDDKRPWYLSLKRSFEHLKILRKRVEDELLPQMDRAAQKLAVTDFSSMSDMELKEEIEKRKDTYKKWKDVYWDEFIPLAHGMRLFGQFYNDTLNPEDPYEFMDLLSGEDLIALERNKSLQKISYLITDDVYNKYISHGVLSEDVDKALDEYMNKFCYLSGEELNLSQEKEGFIKLLLQLYKNPVKKKEKNRKEQEIFFMSFFEEKKKPQAIEMLELGRASYRLRDNDNIYLGRIKGQLQRAMNEYKLRGFVYEESHESRKENNGEREFSLKARQISGQSAGQGIATGTARVILKQSDLFEFRHGEILVCDAVQPDMTFIVPLASAIVERRGGMLIHGAIIAREYGLPCITGVTDAASLIHTGDEIMVDGYLGIVIIQKSLSVD